MRFMVMVKATEDSEAGALPTQQLLEDMGKYNEALIVGTSIQREPLMRRATDCER